MEKAIDSEAVVPEVTDETEKTPESFVADSLATGILVMLAMTVVQRGFGFLRGVLFCRLMDDSQVGLWAMAFGFITMITPIMLLGMPGSLPRFVEHYRGKGHLKAFVRRLTYCTMACAAVFAFLLTLFPRWFGWFIFLEPQNEQLIQSVGVGVVAIIAFYFVNELVSSLRQVRVVSLMQFIQSVAFTMIGVGWLWMGGGMTGLVLTFAIATVLAMLPGLVILKRGWRGLPAKENAPASEGGFDAGGMWRRILPYASAVWFMNVMANAFSLSDRYMILHLTPGGEAMGQAAVGQYHSGRIFPVLLLSLAAMVSGVLLPYLTADWEAGRKQAVSNRLRTSLVACSAVFTFGAAVAILVTPYVFATLLENRYAAGLSLMPMAFTFCIWYSLFEIGENYLWVTEKGKWVAAVLGAGLIANIALNAILLPRMGLQGAVTATLCANGLVLLGTWLSMHLCGYRLDQTTFYITLWPACLLVGPWVAIACVTATLAVSELSREFLVEAWNTDHALRLRNKFPRFSSDQTANVPTQQ